MTARKLLQTLHDDRYRVFVLLLSSYNADRGFGLNIGRHQKLSVPKAACLSCP